MITEKEYLKAKMIVEAYECEQLNKPASISHMKCCDNQDIEIFYKNTSNKDGSGRMGVTHKIFKCKNCVMQSAFICQMFNN